ncbi:MAG: ribonuclease HI family protein [Blastocatellia bacterium]|nr:ribonuclease HI family protein [Blastocatellia bacterium]
MNKLSQQACNITIFADGLCEPRNPGGFACWGWVALSSDNEEIASSRGCIGQGEGMTNNVAEYRAVIEALDWAARNSSVRTVEVFTDSQLVVRQINGQWACRAANLLPLLEQARTLMEQTRATLRWIPREQNERADRLTRIAYKEARKPAR